MLILFKPWVGLHDLHDNNQSWSDTFTAFFGNAQPSVLKVLDNMQILHECRDSRDDHYAARCVRLSNASGYYGSGTDARTDDDFGGDGDTELAILQHLQSLDNAQSDHVAYTNKNVISCLAHTEKVGMFNCGTSVADTLAPTTSSDKIQVTELSEQLELLWEQEYECRHAAEKQASMHTSPTDNMDTNKPKSGKKSSVNDGSAFREALDTPMTFLPSVRQDIAASDANVDVNVDQVIQEWTLNLEQSRAFRIIAEHSLEDKPKALRMFLGSQGGTEKSRVINALKLFFEKRNQKRGFRLASYTGVAARNISGMTLHAALLLNQRGQRGNRSKSNRDLVSMWQGVDYLFIDEVSMVSSKLLVQVSAVLCLAKEDQSVFGGVNIIFAGDFAQLLPVGDSKLFSRINHVSSLESAQKTVQGRLLWFAVKTVVVLTQVMRQEGKENETLMSLDFHGNGNTQNSDRA